VYCIIVMMKEGSGCGEWMDVWICIYTLFDRFMARDNNYMGGLVLFEILSFLKLVISGINVKILIGSTWIL